MRSQALQRNMNLRLSLVGNKRQKFPQSRKIHQSYKVTGMELETGYGGVQAMFKVSFGWDTFHEVVFLGEDRAVIHATGPPPQMQHEGASRPV